MESSECTRTRRTCTTGTLRVYLQNCFNHANTVSIIQPSVQHDMRGVAFWRSNTFTNYSMVKELDGAARGRACAIESPAMHAALHSSMHNGLHKLLVQGCVHVWRAGGSSCGTRTPGNCPPLALLCGRTMCCLPLDLILRNRARVLVES